MALAQYIAGMGFSNVGLGIVHSMLCGELAKAGFADIELENTVFPNFQSYDYSLLSKELQNASNTVFSGSTAGKVAE